MKREVRPELLDSLPATSLEARQARHELRSINRLMGNARILARWYGRERWEGSPVLRIAEIGSGDGSWLAQFAQRTRLCEREAELMMIDKQCDPLPETLALFGSWGWEVTPIRGDLFSWLERQNPARIDLLLANLLLHHFDAAELAQLLGLISRQSAHFLACEPRRTRANLLFGRGLRLLGFGPVTRHDALASIRAGFCGRELSAVWPAADHWRLRESAAGLFSHCFSARRIEGVR